MLLCETMRQTFPLLAHAAYGMPLGFALSWKHFQYAVNPSALVITGRPAEIELRVDCHGIRYQRSIVAAMSMHIEAFRDGALLAVADTSFGCHQPAVYQSLRRGRTDAQAAIRTALTPPAAIDPRLDGRSRTRDTVLAPGAEPDNWQLRVDTNHPILFDHAPGMLILESIRQAAHASAASGAPALAVAMDVAFDHYIEFDTPCWIRATALPSADGGASRSSKIEATQDQAPAFAATADLALL